MANLDLLASELSQSFARYLARVPMLLRLCEVYKEATAILAEVCRACAPRDRLSQLLDELDRIDPTQDPAAPHEVVPFAREMLSAAVDVELLETLVRNIRAAIIAAGLTLPGSRHRPKRPVVLDDAIQEMVDQGLSLGEMADVLERAGLATFLRACRDAGLPTGIAADGETTAESIVRNWHGAPGGPAKAPRDGRDGDETEFPPIYP